MENSNHMDRAEQGGKGGPFDLGLLRRFPDVEAENLFAYDATDELILREAADALAHTTPGKVTIVGDRYGAMTLGAAAQWEASAVGAQSLRVHQDPLAGELALARNADQLGRIGSYRSLPLVPELFAGTEVVLWQLPRGLEEIAEVANLINRHAAPGVQVFSGGRVKHMTRAMNDVLAGYFGEVTAGLAWHKSRPVKAAKPRAEVPASAFPKKEHHPDLGLWLCAHGATFGGTKVDVGTRFLLDFLPQMRVDADSAIDLGCGNGTIAAALAAARPGLHVVATDQSAAAVASTAATARANGLSERIEVLRDDALASFAPNSADLIVLNPPFHMGATIHAGIAHKLFAAAARVLAPGGELWCVYNRHLDYRATLEDIVGPTRVIGRNSKFTVTVSTK